MGNKVKYNLKNVHAARLTETVSSSGETTFSYESPKAIPGAVSISLDLKSEHIWIRTGFPLLKENGGMILL